MFGLGPGELFVIFLVVFLIFGPKALPDIARSLGEAMKMFKKEAKDLKDHLESDETPRNSSEDKKFSS
ncbi:MAG: twin-arginine translocase TatA/TatE family subunit [Candidatus Omnitrophica bacterium]|nr:twin-arginine translocase TatA/TatE family subunit [Candidatus Omnitrophota bacterium]